MIDRTFLANALQHPFDSLSLASASHLEHIYTGKVREVYALEEFLVVVTTDRVSAFDVVLGTVPVRGQILNQLTAFWAQALHDVISTHLVALPDPNVMVVHPCTPIRVEVVVRGYITGVTDTSLWKRYAQGERVLYGHRLPEGLHKDDPLPEPLITPTTKALVGHDEPLTHQDIVSRGLLDAPTWDRVQDCALRVFARGQQVAAEAGLILVDTKYEFGWGPDGELLLMDEFHTPDSSRYWLAGDAERQNWDKELLRQWLEAQQFAGSGQPPPLDRDVTLQVAARYAEVMARLTGQPLVPGAYPATPRIAACLQALTAAQFRNSRTTQRTP